MVKVIDRRPTKDEDSLRRLLSSVKTPASVPHGIKVARYGEYVSFIDSAGVGHKWDGDAIATYDLRMAEAEQKMEQAKAELEQAKAELEAAKDRTDAADGDLSGLVNRVDAATAQVAELKAQYPDLESKLSEATAAVDAVKSRVSTVEAQAAGLVDDVSSAAQAAADATGAAADAKQVAEAAGADAARVAALAENAQADAQAATRQAQEARDAAASKPTITYSNAAPVGLGANPGDTHYKVGDSGEVVAWWRWDGSGWAEQAVNGRLIAADTITGQQIEAQSVAAVVGSFVKVNAENVTVTGELAARVVSAMDTTTKNLVVTDSALLQHATLLGSTVAEELNVTKKLVARDAIVDGTLDVAQLNVTEAMSAEIVRAMTTQTKNLIVSEEAILQRATVIESLVTPRLIAEKINAKELGAEMVTAGGLQTDEAPSRGLKINSGGIVGFDSTGVQTIKIDGSSNRIVGEFSTGPYGSPRVNIYNKFNPAWGIEESVIDLQASGMSGVSSYDGAVARLTSSAREGFSISLGSSKRLIIDGSGVVVAGSTISLGGNVGVAGKLRAASGFNKSNGFHGMSNGPYNINPNTALDVNIRFANIGTRPYIIPTVSFDDAGDINLSVWNVTTSSARIRIYNSGTNTIRGLYLDTIILHLER